MKFFILKANREMPQPYMKNWFTKLDLRDAIMERHHNIARITNVDVELSQEGTFPDVISFPHFMVANDFSKILWAYEPGLIIKFIALFDKKNSRSQMYAMPIFERISCLAVESELNLDQSEIRRAVIEVEKVKGRTFFAIADVKNLYVVAELHLVESLLRRQIMGLSLQEVELC